MNLFEHIYLNKDTCANKRTLCVAPMSIIRRVGKAAKNIPPAFPGFARGIRDNFRISAGSPGYPCTLPGLPAYVLRKQTGRLTSGRTIKMRHLINRSQLVRGSVAQRLMQRPVPGVSQFDISIRLDSSPFLISLRHLITRILQTPGVRDRPYFPRGNYILILKDVRY